MAKPLPTRKQTLHQVVVERTEDGELLTVGPAMLKEACEQFAEAIRAQIACGREKAWSNPHVVAQIAVVH